MNLYTEDHLPSDLLALVAVLYRFPDPATGKRAPFDPDDLPTLMRDVQRVMPDWLQWGVYAWFARFCEYLLTGEFIIDGQTVTFAPVFGRRDKDGERAEQHPLHGGRERGVRHRHGDRPHTAVARAAEAAGRQAAGGRADEAIQQEINSLERTKMFLFCLVDWNRIVTFAVFN